MKTPFPVEEAILYFRGKPIRVDPDCDGDTEYVVSQDIYDILLCAFDNMPGTIYQGSIIRR